MRVLGKMDAMKYDNLGGYTRINPFVEAKLQRLLAMERSFASLYTLMFSERENILFERSLGYRIEKITYGEAYDQIERLSGGLAARCAKFPPDSVVGLYMDSGPEWIVAFWMILRCGFRPLLLNPRLSDDVLFEVVRRSNAQCVVSDGKQFRVTTVIFNQIIKKAAPASAFGSEVLVISSGTSSHVKICGYGAEEFTHQIEDSTQIIRDCAQIKRHYEGQLKLLAFLPFCHVFGLVALYIWFAFFSRTFVALPDYSPQTILNTIRRHRVTHIFAVPIFWNQVYAQAMKTIAGQGKEDAFRKAMRTAEKIGDIPVLGNAFCKHAFREVRENLFGESVCFMITGGSDIQKDVLQFFNSIGYYLTNGYGMTEMGITSVELSPKKRIRSEGFVGQPLPSVQYAIQNGELLIQGTSTAKYILEDNIRYEAGGWFRTNDLAECKNGHYRILGRKDELVIGPNGENLNPNLLEPQLMTPGVRELCLVGIPKAVGTQPALLVRVDRSLTRDRASELLRELRSRMAQQKLKATLLLTTEPLLRENEFKRNRNRIARDLAQGNISILDPQTLRISSDAPDDALMDYLKSLFAVTLGKSDVSPDADFFLDEGGSSLDYFAMISQIQEDYPVSFPSAPDGSLNTIRSLYDYITAHG